MSNIIEATSLDKTYQMPRQKILLVDDEPDILELIRYNLLLEGYEVHTASNGQEGLETALRIRPDLILLDVMMPVLDGMETCALLRKEPSLSDCIIAFLNEAACNSSTGKLLPSNAKLFKVEMGIPGGCAIIEFVFS